MKKILLALLLFTVITEAQVENPIFAKKYKSAGQSISLDGSSEYGSKSSPVNLDLNGAERITSANDRDFENAGYTWAGHGNHSIARSTTDKRAGSYSLAMTSSAVGDATTNYTELPATSFNTIEAGKKYTKEIWARGTGILGSDLINGWDFTSNWNSNNATINNANTFTTTLANGYIRKDNLTTLYKTYQINIAGTFDGATSLRISSYDGTTIYKSISTTAFNTTFEFYASSTGLLLQLRDVIGSCNITTFTLKEITLPTLTLAIGNQTKTVSSISCVPGTFTKVVFNFLATANEVGQPIKIYANQADVIYLDDASLTEKYTRAKGFWIKTSTTGTKKAIANRYTGTTGLQFYVNTSNKLEAVYGDGTTSKTIAGSTTVTDGSYHLASLNIDYDYAQIYLDGVADGSVVDVSGVGKVNPVANLNIGFLSADYFNGNIGEGIIFRNFLPTASQWLQMKRGGIVFNNYAVFFTKWQGLSDTQMLSDRSSSLNSLTGVNLTTADQERGNYPSK